jgi:hypothetical protein
MRRWRLPATPEPRERLAVDAERAGGVRLVAVTRLEDRADVCAHHLVEGLPLLRRQQRLWSHRSSAWRLFEAHIEEENPFTFPFPLPFPLWETDADLPFASPASDRALTSNRCGMRGSGNGNANGWVGSS